MSKQERVLTGDRITGKLHLGHYVGSLKNRLLLQEQYETYILLADVQALTTHFENPKIISDNLRNVALDYLSVGLHPEKSTMFVQSMIPEIAELTVYYSMFVTVNTLRHNPTIKTEAKQRGYKDMYYGFLGYPVSQAADITFCKATLVPVGDDQIPHIEQTRKIVRRFNDLYAPVLVEPEAIVGDRLEGLDGGNKMSKSMGNAIFLDSSRDEVTAQIKRAKTDPNRIHKHDPGNPDICPIYDYHSAFRPEGCDEIRQSCRAGTIGCSDCKGLAIRAINELLEPIRERRAIYSGRPKDIDEIMIEGTRKARRVAGETMTEVREAMGINYFA
ncbi:Tryptophan--tRNA ligase 2 [Paenibacillus solanacearum]|uniref:Tryptophan--tRNA ligase n=1 Tax=Paenibacillus solanacearum TaxID=2048548 RepID=A0A916K330_9BACL|nr:tryptophan--tRNA ligase [Paenibacillus solanacearum]CAG7634525.1 Tryptophan--tRNA ligase 2 [Paenibacillus solanacearum]